MFTLALGRSCANIEKFLNLIKDFYIILGYHIKLESELFEDSSYKATQCLNFGLLTCLWASPSKSLAFVLKKKVNF